MTSSSNQSGTSCKTAGDDPQDPILASIRTMEAIRDFATDIIPLRPDGANIHEWVGEIDKTLSDLVDREKYLQGTPVAPYSKAEDKIARNLIYWTIPRELRSCINDATSAHDAYNALKAQFLRNNRTSHMAALVDLFNVHAEISEPHHLTTLYDRMYKGVNELVASGFVINEDTLLGALFQIAVGRGNSQLYAATSQCLDTLAPSDRPVTSREVAAAARIQFEHLRNTVFDEDPITTHPPSEVAESLQAPVTEEGDVTHPPNDPNLSTNVSGMAHAARQSAEQPHPANVPAKRQNPPEKSQLHRESGLSSTRADQPVASKESSSSAPKESAAPPVIPATQPIKTSDQVNVPVKSAAQATQATQPINTTAQLQPSLLDNGPTSTTSGSGKARAISPAPASRSGSPKPPTTTNTAPAGLFGATPATSSPLVTNITPASSSTTSTPTLFGKTVPTAAATSLFGKSASTATPPTPGLFGSQSSAQSNSNKPTIFGGGSLFGIPNPAASATPAAKSPEKSSTPSFSFGSR
ncbi:hypothetical protein PtA15_1A378 [Puccinia triticina]|uniref:Uncharacterized protein n=1 Tax=Puccinia triticina TaxID=208348 RepID=A0ABY7C7A0_9BASI|nr:uncharacterized protein PtA15_1A378 [Puccinia triticina]WAQ81040.1 hypothetical protein PtA15_1A378 [Puccinia triticina]